MQTLVAALAPRYRVLSVAARPDCAYQVHVAAVVGVLGQLGLFHVVVVAEGLTCASALLLAAWYPERVGALALVDAAKNAPPGDALMARSLRECPPDWPLLRSTVLSPVLELAGGSPTLVSDIEALLVGQLP